MTTAKTLNRRNFIKLGGGAFALASAHTLFGAAVPSKKLRLCVVGCARTANHGNGFVVDPKGWRGRGFQVMNRFAELPNCVVTVLCDIDANALDDAAAAFKILNEKSEFAIKILMKA